MIIYSHLQNQDNRHQAWELWQLHLIVTVTKFASVTINFSEDADDFHSTNSSIFQHWCLWITFFYYNEPHFHRKGVNSVHRHMHITQFKYVQIAPRQYFPVGALRITWFYLCILSSHKSNKIILWAWPSVSCVCKIESKQVKGKRTKVKEK